MYHTSVYPRDTVYSQSTPTRPRWHRRRGSHRNSGRPRGHQDESSFQAAVGPLNGVTPTSVTALPRKRQ
eukprot:CCRYP_011296-RA/>CCRYP_011296-RA protein AED:0.48 eAED:0.48 QI:124/1/1/1/0.5/0/3/448/68